MGVLKDVQSVRHEACQLVRSGALCVCVCVCVCVCEREGERGERERERERITSVPTVVRVLQSVRRVRPEGMSAWQKWCNTGWGEASPLLKGVHGFVASPLM